MIDRNLEQILHGGQCRPSSDFTRLLFSCSRIRHTVRYEFGVRISLRHSVRFLDLGHSVAGYRDVVVAWDRHCTGLAAIARNMEQDKRVRVVSTHITVPPHAACR